MAYIISHRGNNNHNYEENTIDAILDVLSKEYIDGVEFDIRITKDNKFVLSHNPVVYNLGLITHNYLKDIKKYNISELEEVLKKIKTDKIILIDIKSEISDNKNLIKKLNKILKKYKQLNIYLCSFNYDLIKNIKQKYKYKSGLIISTIMNKNKDYKIFDFISINYRIYKKINKMTMLWTINKEEVIKKYIDKDLYIITDKAYLLKN